MATIEERMKGAPTRLITLAACGFARTVEHLLKDNRSKDAIETAERFVEGLATEDEVKAALKAVGTEPTAATRIGEIWYCAFRKNTAAQQAEWEKEAATAAKVAVLKATGLAVATEDFARIAADVAREVRRAAWFATAPTNEEEADTAEFAAEARNQSILDCILPARIQFPFPAYIRGLATTMYEKQDWALMPILADALAEMGLEDIAEHCRQPIHTRGCYVLDAILGKPLGEH